MSSIITPLDTKVHWIDRVRNMKLTKFVRRRVLKLSKSKSVLTLYSIKALIEVCTVICKKIVFIIRKKKFMRMIDTYLIDFVLCFSKIAMMSTKVGMIPELKVNIIRG